MSSFCTAKATHIFSAKNFSIFAYHSIKIILADRCRTYSARKSVMAKKKQNKKKRRLAVSNPSDDNSLDGSTTPQGYTARCKTHRGGSYLDAECVQSVNLPVISPQSLVSQSLVKQAPGSLSLVS